MRRFPELARMFSLHSESDIPEELPPHLLAPIEVIPSKQGLPTAKEGGKLLHSLYNPLREAEQAASAAKKSGTSVDTCVFFSCGLGYTVISYAARFPTDTIIVVENDPRYFFTALSLVDWSAVFAHPRCIIALATTIESVVSLIEHSGGFSHCALSENPAHSAHAGEYFSALKTLISRNKQKALINVGTLEKFSSLWLSNSCRNLHFLAELDGVSLYKDRCPEQLPALILAAGPTLEETLPRLPELKKRMLVIAVDTALRACLRVGVEPDFIILADPQYYAYRHIAGLSSLTSILITESAAYPSVYRFPCKKIVLTSSLFPLGQYIESKIGAKGTLSAGGSVSTTAWDFARFIGAREIFVSGLDLGFPHAQTHIRGSTFEESIHAHSARLSPAETQGTRALFGADMRTEHDYAGNSILTDTKMKMFAWWFESKQEEYKEHVTSYSLSEKSLRIPNFKLASADDILSLPEKSALRAQFFDSAENAASHSAETAHERAQAFDSAVQNLKDGLSELYETAKKGMALVDNGITAAQPASFLSKLSAIDEKILRSEYKEIASLVFPTDRKLSALFEELPPLRDEVKSSFQKSKIVYKELMTSIRQYQALL